MKKIAISFAIMFCIIFTTQAVFANNEISTKTNKDSNILQTEQTEKSTTTNMANTYANEKKTLEDFVIAYHNNETYGLTAYILSKVQQYSIPFCFIGVAISAIYQYVLGIRKLDTRDKGFAIMISIITIFVIAQVLPLIFAIVVNGWEV